MLRLIFSDLRDHIFTWIGAFIIAVGCGYIGGWVVSLQATADYYSDSLHWSIQNAATMMFVFSAIAGVAVLVSAASLTVSMQRRSYALWQLVNVSPRMVNLIVLVQLTVVAILGSLFGTLLSVTTFTPLFPWVFSTQDAFNDVIPIVGIQGMPAVWIVIAGIFVFGGMKSAISAGRTPPLVALREEKEKGKRITWFRILVFVALIVGVFGVFSVMENSSPYDASSWAVLIPVLVAGTLAVLAPLLFPIILTAWTALIPQKRWNAWYLARHSARYGLGISTSIETPIMVGFGLAAGLFSILNIFANYESSQGALDTSGWSLDLTTALVVLGGPIFLCALGAAVSVVMSSRSRTLDVALLSAEGAKPSTLIMSSFFEAVIHAITASIVGVICVVVSSVIVAGSLGLPLFESFKFEVGSVVSFIGFILVLVAILIPTTVSLNRETAVVLNMQE